MRAGGELAGRIIVDCTNPLSWEDGLRWNSPEAGSVAEEIARAYPGAKVVKGFNHFGAEIHADPSVEGGAADAFFAGDDEAAKTEVMEIAGKLGFRPNDAGPLRNAALLENLAVLWIHLATTSGDRRFAFRIQHRIP